MCTNLMPSSLAHVGNGLRLLSGFLSDPEVRDVR
jgi:hypothetical protein